MAKRKPADAVGMDENEFTTSTDLSAADGAGVIAHAEASPDAKRSKWVPQFGNSGDYQAGVRLIEDRKNERMLIKFDEKPSDEVRALVKSQEYGYRFDAEDQVWFKKINPAKPRQIRAEAQDLVFKVANMIRQEKGLELKEEFSPGR